MRIEQTIIYSPALVQQTILLVMIITLLQLALSPLNVIIVISFAFCCREQLLPWSQMTNSGRRYYSSLALGIRLIRPSRRRTYIYVEQLR